MAHRGTKIQKVMVQPIVSFLRNRATGPAVRCTCCKHLQYSVTVALVLVFLHLSLLESHIQVSARRKLILSEVSTCLRS